MRLTYFGDYVFPVAAVEDAFGARDVPDTFFDTTYGPVDALASDDLDFGDDVLARSFDIVAATPTALQTALDAARGCRGVYAALGGEAYDGTERWTMARCLNVSTRRTNRNFNWQRVTMRFRAPSALWNGAEHDTTVAGVSDGSIVTITNGGNANVDDLVLRITPTAIIDDVDISKDRLLDPSPPDCFYVRYSATVGIGNVLMLDSGRWVVSNDGFADWSALNFQSPHLCNSLFRLRPGANPVKFEWGGGGTISVRYTFIDKWR